MADIEPRYEFRAWGERLAVLREGLERRAMAVKAESRETYLIPQAIDRCNAKIRAGLIDIKILLAEHRGLEQWQPILKVGFPLDRTVIASQVFPRLEIRVARLAKARYEIDEFLNEVAVSEPAIVIVELAKTRFQFSFANCLAEFTVVHFNGVAHDTVAVESADAEALLRLIHEIGLDGAENLSYVRYFKRLLGLEER
jgi:hypothetical protein